MMALKKQPNNPFHFKQFSINHHNSTMKVGTDAILLGVWCDVENADNILDIGTGSGVIALLMASRSKAKVHAVEIDSMSVNEAKINFNNYNSKQLSVFQDDFNNFAINSNEKYDLIVTNPPFFSDGLLPYNKSRSDARHSNKLNHDQLCKGVASLLSENGKFCLVLPYELANSFIKTASKYNIYLNKQQVIYPKPVTSPNRINMEFRFNKVSSIFSEDIILRNENGSHTDDYRILVSNYLVKF